MDKKALVAYATRHGSTAEIAAKIGKALREGGLAADVLDVGEVRDITAYSKIVLGTCIYYGRWHKSAVSFLKKNAGALKEMPVWLFTCSLSGPENPSGPQGRPYPKDLEPVIEGISPRGIAQFKGRLSPERLGPFERWVVRAIKAPEGDFFDWAAVAAWAEGILAEGKKGESAD